MNEGRKINSEKQRTGRSLKESRKSLENNSSSFIKGYLPLTYNIYRERFIVDGQLNSEERGLYQKHSQTVSFSP